MEKHSVSLLSYPFAHLDLLSETSVFWLFFLLFFSSLTPSHLCFSSVHIVGSLISKLPSTIFCGDDPPTIGLPAVLDAHQGTRLFTHGHIWIVHPVTIQVTLQNEAVTALAISSLQERGIDGMLTKTRWVRKKTVGEISIHILRLLCCEQKGTRLLKHSRLGMGQVHQPSMDGLIWKYAIFVGPLVPQFGSFWFTPEMFQT